MYLHCSVGTECFFLQALQEQHWSIISLPSLPFLHASSCDRKTCEAGRQTAKLLSPGDKPPAPHAIFLWNPALSAKHVHPEYTKTINEHNASVYSFLLRNHSTDKPGHFYSLPFNWFEQLLYFSCYLCSRFHLFMFVAGVCCLFLIQWAYFDSYVHAISLQELQRDLQLCSWRWSNEQIHHWALITVIILKPGKCPCLLESDLSLTSLMSHASLQRSEPAALKFKGMSPFG